MSGNDREMDLFFNSLVGSEMAVADFQATLHEQVAPHAHTDEAFPHLEIAGCEIVNAAVLGANNLKPGDNQSTLSLEWRKMRRNGYLGTNTAVATLSAVSKVYEKRSPVAQDPAIVWKNTDRAIRHTYANAFNHARQAMINELSMRHELNPANHVFRKLVIWNALFSDTTTARISPRAFRVKTDTDGQLDIRPRYAHVSQSENGRRCPATNMRIEVDGESPSALLTFMRTIGTVAVQDIYPHRFSIAKKSITGDFGDYPLTSCKSYLVAPRAARSSIFVHSMQFVGKSF